MSKKDYRELDKGDSYEFLKKAWDASPEELEAYASDPDNKKLEKTKALAHVAGFTIGCAITLVICVSVFKAAGVAVFLRTLPFALGAYVASELVQRAVRKED
jgi:hypothetical protein